MTNPNPSRKVERKIKAWFIVENDGTVRKIYLNKGVAELNVSSYACEQIVPATISYKVSLRKKKK